MNVKGAFYLFLLAILPSRIETVKNCNAIVAEVEQGRNKVEHFDGSGACIGGLLGGGLGAALGGYIGTEYSIAMGAFGGVIGGAIGGGQERSGNGLIVIGSSLGGMFGAGLGVFVGAKYFEAIATHQTILPAELLNKTAEIIKKPIEMVSNISEPLVSATKSLLTPGSVSPPLETVTKPIKSNLGSVGNQQLVNGTSSVIGSLGNPFKGLARHGKQLGIVTQPVSSVVGSATRMAVEGVLHSVAEPLVGVAKLGIFGGLGGGIGAYVGSLSFNALYNFI